MRAVHLLIVPLALLALSVGVTEVVAAEPPVFTTEVGCVANLEVVRTYKDGSLVDVRENGRSCGAVLGSETTPSVGSVIVIIEDLRTPLAVLGSESAPPARILSLPATSTR